MGRSAFPIGCSAHRHRRVVAQPRKARPRPNLFIVGAPKCGTTAWVEYLRTHPDIFFAEIKEPHYFCTDLPGMRWTASLEKYESLFEHAGGNKIVAEGSVMYLYSDAAAREIHAYNPDSKILIFVRAQEDFLPSLHHQYLQRFTENIEDFEKAWRLSENRPADTIPKHRRDHKLTNYAAMGRFSEQVRRYLDLFGKDRVKVIRFRDWTADPRATYLDILSFLGVKDDGRTDFPTVNEAKSYRIKWIGRLLAHPPAILEAPIALLRKLLGRQSLGLGAMAIKAASTPGYTTSISPALRDEIRHYYKSDNEQLERLFGGPSAAAR